MHVRRLFTAAAPMMQDDDCVYEHICCPIGFVPFPGARLNQWMKCELPL